MYSIKSSLVVLISICLLAGCARGPKSVQEEKPLLSVRLTLDTPSTAKADKASTSSLPSYRPGQLIVCSVEVVNNSKDTLRLLLPYVSDKRIDSNTNFLVKTVGSSDLLRRVPVHPGRKFAPVANDVPPSSSTKRTFAFVNLTRNRGDFTLQAEYAAALSSKASAPSHFFSNSVSFRVAGETLWKRDPVDFLLTKEEAIRVATQHYGKPVRRSGARLQENKMGAREWWVTLEKEPADVVAGQDPRIAYLVSPYGAFIIQEAQPFSLDAMAPAAKSETNGKPNTDAAGKEQNGAETKPSNPAPEPEAPSAAPSPTPKAPAGSKQ